MILQATVSIAFSCVIAGILFLQHVEGQQVVARSRLRQYPRRDAVRRDRAA